MSHLDGDVADQGLTATDEGLSQGMRDHLAKTGHGWRMHAFRGTVIHNRTKVALEQVFGRGPIEYTNNNGPGLYVRRVEAAG